MKRGVVLDKNYLQGASAAEVRTLADSHRLIMPGALFYELLTTDPVVRRRCFAKLPPVDDPVLLVDHIGILLSKELVQRRPSGQPSGHRLQIRFRFNERLLSEDYEFPDEALSVLHAQTQDVASDVRQLIGLSETTPSIFPDVLRGSQQQQTAARSRAEAAIARLDAVAGFYRTLVAPPGYAPYPTIAGSLGKWAHIRWVQVLLLFALDLHVRYRGTLREQLTPKVLVRLEHDVHDAQMLALGALEGALATDELKLCRWWHLVRPNGRLFRKAARLANPDALAKLTSANGGRPMGRDR